MIPLFNHFKFSAPLLRGNTEKFLKTNATIYESYRDGVAKQSLTTAAYGSPLCKSRRSYFRRELVSVSYKFEPLSDSSK
jgi:hypothetical protein